MRAHVLLLFWLSVASARRENGLSTADIWIPRVRTRNRTRRGVCWPSVMMARTRITWSVACVAAALAVAAGVVHAQIWRGGYGFYGVPKHPTSTTFVGGFNHCRLMFM